VPLLLSLPVPETYHVVAKAAEGKAQSKARAVRYGIGSLEIVGHVVGSSLIQIDPQATT
jgi:hypothetical protein